MVTRPILERDLEGYFTAQCKKLGIISLKLNVRYSRGWPDRIVVMPDQRVMWVELKRPGGKLSPLQAKIHTTFKQYGHVVHVIDSKEGIDHVLGTSRVSEESR
jgi:VRR-NUC domain